MTDDVLISALTHHAYCPRRAGLVHVEHVWDENVFTLKGTRAHERSDEPAERTERGRSALRALPLWHDDLGLHGRADVVELLPDGTPFPVEHKVGDSGDHAELQLAAQALCLEAMTGRAVLEGAVYSHEDRRRHPVTIDPALRARVEDGAKAIREAIATGHLAPPPRAKRGGPDPRCRHCSLLDACLPATLFPRSLPSPFEAKAEVGELP